MPVKTVDLLQTRIADVGGIASDAAEVNITPGDGAKISADIPDLGDDYVYAWFKDDSGNRELVKISGVSTDTVTLSQRGVSSRYPARAWSQNDILHFAICRQMFDDIADAIADVVTDVEGGLAVHIALTAPHSATATPTANRIAMFDAALRLKSGAAPAAATDVVRKTELDAETLARQSEDSDLSDEISDLSDVVSDLSDEIETIVGSIIFVAADAAPTGMLKCNGAAVSRTTYANLFTVIGETFGAGDGSTTFNLPDLRGEFIRAWDDGRGVDTGRVFGSAQAAALESHSHNSVASDSTANLLSGSEKLSRAGNIYGGEQNYTLAGSSSAATLAPTSSTGGAETRPRNIALLACIKY